MGVMLGGTGPGRLHAALHALPCRVERARVSVERGGMLQEAVGPRTRGALYRCGVAPGRPRVAEPRLGQPGHGLRRLDGRATLWLGCVLAVFIYLKSIKT